MYVISPNVAAYGPPCFLIENKGKNRARPTNPWVGGPPFNSVDDNVIVSGSWEQGTRSNLKKAVCKSSAIADTVGSDSQYVEQFNRIREVKLAVVRIGIAAGIPDARIQVIEGRRPHAPESSVGFGLLHESVDCGGIVVIVHVQSGSAVAGLIAVGDANIVGFAAHIRKVLGGSISFIPIRMLNQMNSGAGDARIVYQLQIPNDFGGKIRLTAFGYPDMTRLRQSFRSTPPWSLLRPASSWHAHFASHSAPRQRS